jgi:excisionase family DNA binding protein
MTTESIKTKEKNRDSNDETVPIIAVESDGCSPIAVGFGGDNRPLLRSVKKAAYLLGIGQSTLYKKISEKKINIVKIGDRTLLHDDDINRVSREGM